MEDTGCFREDTGLKTFWHLTANQRSGIRKRTLQGFGIPRAKGNDCLSARNLETILILSKAKERLFNREQILNQVGMVAEELTHHFCI